MFGKGGGVSIWPCLQHKLPVNTNNQIGRKTWGCYLKNDCYEFISSLGVKSFWSNTMIHFWLYTDTNIYGQAVHWKLTRQKICLVSLKCHQLFNVFTLQLKWFTISTTEQSQFNPWLRLHVETTVQSKLLEWKPPMATTFIHLCYAL